jgi:hypothetical protein
MHLGRRRGSQTDLCAWLQNDVEVQPITTQHATGRGQQIDIHTLVVWRIVRANNLRGDGGILMLENGAPATSGEMQLCTSMAACVHRVGHKIGAPERGQRKGRYCVGLWQARRSQFIRTVLRGSQSQVPRRDHRFYAATPAR